MPGAARASAFVCILRRQFSAGLVRKHPTSRIPRNAPRRIKPDLPIAEQLQQDKGISHKLSKAFYRDFRGRKALIRIIILSPIIGMGLIHSPFEIMRVNGPSMSPLFNANYNAEVDLPGLHTDQILVQTRGLPDLFVDVNAGRKARRKAEGIKSSTMEEEEDTKSSRFRRGQIITFYTPHSPDRIAVKRVVGLPGDRVWPLAGYPGGDDAVIVPWNHLWVEGDAESRQKSIDSNWYGPISQNLVIGEVKAVLTPWWNPTWVDWRHHQWPALEKGRVEETAVAEAASDPQIVTILREWTDGTNWQRLTAMRESPEAFAAYFASSQDVRKRVRQFYRNAALVLAKDDPDSERFGLAQDIIKEMEKIYGVGALRQGMIKRSSKSISPSLSTEDKKAALAAERNLRTQGWAIEREGDGKVRTKPSTA